MSKTEILQELPKLRPDERRDIFELLCELQERDLLNGVGPTADEKALLDRELEDFLKTPNAGSSWRRGWSKRKVCCRRKARGRPARL